MGAPVGELGTHVEACLVATPEVAEVGGVWKQVLRDVGEQIGRMALDTWLKPVRPLSVRSGVLQIEVPNVLFRDWIVENIYPYIADAAGRVLGGPVQIAVAVAAKQQGELFPSRPDTKVKRAVDLPLGTATKTGLVPRYTFSTFVVGTGNQFAHSAARVVADSPGHQYNPLFIYGSVGLGKTHLVNAIGHAALLTLTRKRVFYLSSETFTCELIAHLRRDKMEDFKNKFRQADVLIVDDIQFLSGRERTQEEFFHTFNTLHSAHKQIILTSDKAPSELNGLEERLRNRFESGLIVDIQPPDHETRLAIIRKKAQLKNILLPDDVACCLAARETANVRELEGLLVKLGALAALTHTPVSLELVPEVFRDRIERKSCHDREATIERIQQVVCEYFRLRLDDIRTKRRLASISFPRQLAMFLCRKLTQTSYAVIGTRFGGKDHGTVLYACHAIEQRLKQDAELGVVVARLERLIDTVPDRLTPVAQG